MKKPTSSWFFNEPLILNGRTDTVDTKNSSFGSNAVYDSTEIVTSPKKSVNNRRISELHKRALLKGNLDFFIKNKSKEH